MQRELVSVPKYWNVGGTIDYLRGVAENKKTTPNHFFIIFVVDSKHNLIGFISLDTFLLS